jgi:hypothetical protein
MAREIDIRPNGSAPEVVLTIGQIQTGAFAVYLFEADRVTRRELARGTARKGAGLPISLGAASTLQNKFVTWDVVAIPVTGSRVSATLTVLQDGQQVTSFTDFGDVRPGDNIGILSAGAKLI